MYWKICKVADEIRIIRKRYVTFGYDSQLEGMVQKLIKCEE